MISYLLLLAKPKCEVLTSLLTTKFTGSYASKKFNVGSGSALAYDTEIFRLRKIRCSNVMYTVVKLDFVF